MRFNALEKAIIAGSAVYGVATGMANRALERPTFSVDLQRLHALRERPRFEIKHALGRGDRGRDCATDLFQRMPADEIDDAVRRGEVFVVEAMTITASDGPTFVTLRQVDQWNPDAEQSCVYGARTVRVPATPALTVGKHVIVRGVANDDQHMSAL